MEIPVCHTPSTGCRSSMQRRLLSSMLCEPIHARRHTCVFFWKCSRSSCYLQEFCIVSQMTIYSWKAQIQHSTQRCRLQCIRKKSEEKHCFMEAISFSFAYVVSAFSSFFHLYSSSFLSVMDINLLLNPQWDDDNQDQNLIPFIYLAFSGRTRGATRIARLSSLLRQPYQHLGLSLPCVK